MPTETTATGSQILATPGVVASQIDPANPPGAAVVVKENTSDDEGEINEGSWDEKTKSYIAKLRKENAERRTGAKTLNEKLTATGEQLAAIKKALGLEEEQSPDEKITQLQAGLYESQNEAQLYRVALDNGIGAADVEYFSYLLNKAAAKLGDNEEMSEEDLGAVVAEVKKRSGATASSTSVTTAGAVNGKNIPGGDNSHSVTAEAFSRMTISEKSDLFVKNRALYDKLMVEVRQKRLI